MLKPVDKTNNHKDKSRGYLVFFLFLLLSVFLWALKRLNNEYTSTIPFTVSYKNLPKGQLLKMDNYDVVDIELKTNGSNMLKIHVFEKERTIVLNAKNILKSKKKKYGQRYFLMKNLHEEISSQFDNHVEIVSIDPDTIYYTLETIKE